MQIRLYENVSDMLGIGEEWLVKANGDVVAVFIDGNMRSHYMIVGNGKEITKVA